MVVLCGNKVHLAHDVTDSAHPGHPGYVASLFWLWFVLFFPEISFEVLNLEGKAQFHHVVLVALLALLKSP